MPDVTPPTKAEQQVQWTAEDVAIAYANGDTDAIEAARQAGQLADLLANPSGRNVNTKSVRLGDTDPRISA